MNQTETVIHKGQTIFIMNFENLREVSQIKEVIKKGAAYIQSKPAGSVLCISNITNMHFSSEIKSVFQDFVSSNKPYVKGSAAVGLGGLQAIVFNGLMKLTGRDVKLFATLDEAKEWLINK